MHRPRVDRRHPCRPRGRVPSRQGSVTTPKYPAAGPPGDDPGDRHFATLAGESGQGFILEGGGSLPEATIAFETWGELDRSRGNGVLVSHALTGDSHATGPATPAHPTPGWWNGLIGPGAPIDTDRFFVVCPNVLGGCQGSSGPSSAGPD